MVLEEEHVAEIHYTPSKSKGKYRLIILRKRIRVDQPVHHPKEQSAAHAHEKVTSHVTSSVHEGFERKEMESAR